MPCHALRTLMNGNAAAEPAGEMDRTGGKFSIR